MVSTEDLEACRRTLQERLRRQRTGAVQAAGAPLRAADALRFSGANVHGVAVGRRLVGNALTDQRCVTVYVAAKLPESLLAPDERLPRELDGISVDIVQATPAEFVALTGDGRSLGARAAAAGESAGHEDILFGTLGWFCRWRAGEGPTEDMLAISANHVFADIGRGRAGEAILQPSRGQGGTASDRIARLAKSVPLNRSAVNRVDVAVARLEDGVVPDPGIGQQPAPRGTSEAQADDRVWKVGAATRETHGEVTGIHLATELNLPGSADQTERFQFEDLLIVRPNGGTQFVAPGDSGSLLVRTDDRAAVGVVIGRTWIEQVGQWYGVACKIRDALDELGVELV